MGVSGYLICVLFGMFVGMLAYKMAIDSDDDHIGYT